MEFKLKFPVKSFSSNKCYFIIKQKLRKPFPQGTFHSILEKRNNLIILYNHCNNLTWNTE